MTTAAADTDPCMPQHMVLVLPHQETSLFHSLVLVRCTVSNTLFVKLVISLHVLQLHEPASGVTKQIDSLAVPRIQPDGGAL